jgi:DNA-directed RNA polymerase specialized sigma24 family protein
VIRSRALASLTSEKVAAHTAAPLATELCERYASRVYQFATMVAGSDVEAEDLAQSALERALRGLPSFDPSRGEVEAWLWRIVVNVARDAGRTVKRRQLLFERLVRLRGNPEEPGDVPLGVDHQRLLRSVLALRYGADLEYSAVGRALGMSANAAAVAAHRALKSLRRMLLEVET